jgi:predicted YcjX-like family ATPase
MDLARVLGAHREQARSTKGRAGRYLLPRQARGSASLDFFPFNIYVSPLYFCCLIK